MKEKVLAQLLGSGLIEEDALMKVYEPIQGTETYRLRRGRCYYDAIQALAARKIKAIKFDHEEKEWIIVLYPRKGLIYEK